MSKRLLFFTIGIICVCSSMAQTSNSHLLFQYFGANENQSELNYILGVLEKNNLTSPGPDQEEAIIESHQFYLSHREEIDMKIKAEELIVFRSVVKGATKEAKAAGWAKALGTFATNFSGALSAAQQQQNVDLQNKINRETKIQSFLARHSTSTPQRYTQNFGTKPVETTTTKKPRVTTSNGLEEPLPGAKRNSSSNHIEGTNNTFDRRIIQAVYVSGNQLVACKLNYHVGRVWAYSTSKDPLGHDDWHPLQIPETPAATMSIRDGDYAIDYKYTISGAGMKFYFNM